MGFIKVNARRIPQTNDTAALFILIYMQQNVRPVQKKLHFHNIDVSLALLSLWIILLTNQPARHDTFVLQRESDITLILT